MISLLALPFMLAPAMNNMFSTEIPPLEDGHGLFLDDQLPIVLLTLSWVELYWNL